MTNYTSLAVAAFAALPATAADLSPIEELGKALFFDPTLSVTGTQSCAACHEPAMGFGGPEREVNAGGGVYEGAVAGRFANRKPPTAAYASPAPVFHHTYEDGEVLFVGGSFVDGRATGHLLGNPAADQALGPFLNPLEMALPHAACVVQLACDADAAGVYPVSLSAVWGDGICDIAFPADLATACTDPEAEVEIADADLAEKIDAAFHAIGRSIGAYEASAEVNRYASRYDKYLAGDTGALSAEEQFGLALFEGKGLCAECHVTGAGPRGEPPLLTDFTYDNLGVPRNPANPWYGQAAYNPDGAAWVDPGLGGYLRTDPLYAPVAAAQDGKHKVPTLRNVDARDDPSAPKAYMHNGYFKTLAGIVTFYNTRDLWPRCAGDMVTEAEALERHCWPAPEVAANVNADELGDLGLTVAEEAALVAFMKALTDE